MNAGDVIDGKYRVEVQLGEGGMGVVVAATHMTLESTFAIKILKKDALKFPEVPRRFEREARAASRLRSEHVVRVTDVGKFGPQPYMVMEMLHGEDVSSQLKQGPLPIHIAVDYVVQACEGLAEAHALGMVHRDVKPANLFITRRPNGSPLIKLLDFGIATAAYGDVDHKLTTTQSVMGSPSYMSPEQLRAARDVDARSDIWSLGVSLYEMLTARQPFVGPTLTALTLSIVGDPHPEIPGCPPQLMAIINRCLSKNRELRYPNVGELAQALAPFLAHGDLAASMVVGTLSQPVPPTLLGLEPGSASFRHRPSTNTPAATMMPRPLTSTTSHGAGESANLDARRGKGVWIGLGATALIATIAVALIIRSTSSDGTPAANAATTKTADPPKQDPAKPIITPLDPAKDLTKVANPPTPKDPAVDLAKDPGKDPGKDLAKDPAKDPGKDGGKDTANNAFKDGTKDPGKDPKTVAKPPRTGNGRPPVTTIRKQPITNTGGDGKRPVDPYPNSAQNNGKPKDPPKDPPPKQEPCSPSDPKCGL